MDHNTNANVNANLGTSNNNNNNANNNNPRAKKWQVTSITPLNFDAFPSAPYQMLEKYHE